MVVLDFREIETFTTPDGDTYEILPLDVNDMDLVYRFIELTEDTGDAGAESAKEQNKVVYKELMPICEEIVDKSVLREGTSEPLPRKWKTLKTLMTLTNHVMSATMDRDEVADILKGDDTPLHSPGERSSESSGRTSTPSKKRRGNQKKKS